MMLQRAANNTYSWWAASHVRTKQSKWLEQNLQDMEVKVESVLKLITEDGDSFAKRAEMYYKKRPELINFVEESYKAYRSLAERYDHISHELASVLPDQVPPYSMEDYDDDSPRVLKKDMRSATKKLKKLVKAAATKSGMSKDEAMEKIDKLQKEILILQTEKEFVKSTYEGGVAKYWEIEKTIKEKQEFIFSLKGEFGETLSIEPTEAQKIMAGTALESCDEKLIELEKKEETVAKEAEEERERMKKSEERFNAFKTKFLEEQVSENSSVTSEEELKQPNEANSQTAYGDESITVTEMAERIDDLVSKVINLESTVSTHEALVYRLKTENDDLHAVIQNLEDNNAKLMEDRDGLIKKLRELEEKLNGLRDLDKSVKYIIHNIQFQFLETRGSLNDLNKKLPTVRPAEKIENFDDSDKEKALEISNETSADNEESKKSEQFSLASLVNTEQIGRQVSFDDEKTNHLPKIQVGNAHVVGFKPEKVEEEEEWKQMFINGMKEREQLLLSEYTNVLKNYKEVKQKLLETETQLKKTAATEENKESSEQGTTTTTTKTTTTTSPLEDEIRENIDQILEENLEFWINFSSSFNQIPKFDMGIQELKSEIAKLEEKKQHDKSNTAKYALRSDVRPIYRQLKETHNELTIWLEKSSVLKDKVSFRFGSLSEIEKQIAKFLKPGHEEQENRSLSMSSYKAGKFQGEIVSMREEASKVSKELKSGLAHIKDLQLEVEKILASLSEDFALANPPSNTTTTTRFQHQENSARVPLSTFICDKPKKRQSFFACMQPSVYRKKTKSNKA